MNSQKWLNQKWFDKTQPQTLQNAVILLYLNAAFAVLGLLLYGGLSHATVLLGAVGGWGIANEKKWGYWLGLVAAFVPATLDGLTFLHILSFGVGGFGGFLTIAFEVLLVVLLIHPMSREYQRIWFK